MRERWGGAKTGPKESFQFSVSREAVGRRLMCELRAPGARMQGCQLVLSEQGFGVASDWRSFFGSTPPRPGQWLCISSAVAKGRCATKPRKECLVVYTKYIFREPQEKQRMSISTTCLSAPGLPGPGPRATSFVRLAKECLPHHVPIA